MDPEVYKLILNVREVTERTKTLTFVNCRIKFNQMTQTSFVPFRQSLIFTFTPADRHKAVEFKFEKDYREIARLMLRLDSHYLTNRFEIEKWYELENVDRGGKMLAKISLSTMKYTVETSRSRPSLKQNNFVETRPIEGSPRLSYLTNRLSYIKNPRTPGDEHYSQVSPHQSIVDYNQQDYMSAPHPSLSSRHLDLRLNLQSAVKNLRAEISPKEPVYTVKGRDVKNNYQPTKGPKITEPLTHREREPQEKKHVSRKTKSLEKPINASGSERHSASKYDESNYADSRFGSYRKSIDSSKGDRQSSAKKYDREDSEKKIREQTEKNLERLLRDRNIKLRKENRKFEQLIWDVERTRDRYETEGKKNTERLEYYMDKCMSLERELQFTQNQLALWKSKSEIIRLLENELEGLRRIIKEKDRNIDMERAIQKKRTDFEKATRDLQDENMRHREKIDNLEKEIEELTKKNHLLRQEKEKHISENVLLKVRVAALEVNEEQMKQLNVQKEEIVGEMDMLRTSNKQLRELIMDQKEIIWQADEQQNIKFNDNIVKLKRRIENINNTTFSHLQNVQDYLTSNLDLKNGLDKIEEIYNLDADSQPSSPEKGYSREREREREREKEALSYRGELDKNLDLIKTFTDNNKKLEQHIYEAKTLKREASSTGKFKSADFNPNVIEALKAIHSTMYTTRTRQEKPDEFVLRKPLYIPAKDDPIDAKLAEFINSHPETRKLMTLFKRKIPGIYMFGLSKICPKLESGKLYVKDGKSYVSMDTYVNLNIDAEYEKRERKEKLGSGFFGKGLKI